MIDLCLSFNKLTVFAGSYYAVCVFSQQYGAAKPFGERLFFGKWIVVGGDAVFYFNDILYQLPAVDDNPVGCYPSCHIKKICYVLLQRLIVPASFALLERHVSFALHHLVLHV